MPHQATVFRSADHLSIGLLRDAGTNPEERTTGRLLPIIEKTHEIVSRSTGRVRRTVAIAPVSLLPRFRCNVFYVVQRQGAIAISNGDCTRICTVRCKN